MNLGLGLNIASNKSFGLFASNIQASLSSTGTPDPTAIYSLRLVNQDWLGLSVVNVRRSGDNAEKEFTALDIETGIMGDWITSGGLVPRDAFVTDWYDQSGNGNHASQVADASQPKIWDSLTGLVTENGKPALDFDGVDDLLLISDFAYSTTELATIVVQNPDDVITDVILGHYRTDNNQRSFNVRFFGNSYGFSTSSDGTNFTILESNETTTGQTLYFAQYDGSQTGLDRVKGYVNTTQITYTEAGISTESLPSSLHDSTASLSIGGFLSGATTGSGLYNGKMQEIILYASDQSANRTDIENNVNAYYAVYGVPYYRQRVADDSGTFVIEGRDQTVYNSVTIPEMPSLMCSCDAYKATKLYNIIPA